MAANKMNTTLTEGVNTSTTPKMTKEEAQQKTDAELLQMIQDAKGHTGNDFSDHMNCGFSYSHLTKLMHDRGYENGWHKVSEGSAPIIKPMVILMKKSEETTTRKSFVIEESIAEEWKEFNQNVPFPSVTLGLALNRFMDDVRSGRVKFELKI